MARSLAHRGPDDEGVWADAAAGIALGHRRLSILDLSPEGRQPMFSESGRYVIVFNGEIYNYREIRSEMDAGDSPPKFRGGSDTEVMLAAFERWGIGDSLRRFNGMFAFALWDRKLRRLWIARDRLGEKPLYYGWCGRTFMFASELKALRAHPAFDSSVDRDALSLFLNHNYVPAPHSIYKGIQKLEPASYLSVEPEAGPSPPRTYWSVREVAEKGVANPFTGSLDDAVEELDALMGDSVRLRMVSDVPLGEFLSGGIDSSTIVALMQKASPRPVRTFTIGFHESSYNEAKFAAAVAHHLGTDHTELYVTPQEAIAVIPELPTLYDEPFSDSSQIPTFLVSRLARNQVTVALSGDGGDELFGGYVRYNWAQTIWRTAGWMPASGRKALSGTLRWLSPEQWDFMLGGASRMLPSWTRQSHPGDKIHKIAQILPAATQEEVYWRLVAHWPDAQGLVRQGRPSPTILSDRARWAQVGEFAHRMMYVDTVTYLPDDILVKLDRASMGVSLESRVPMLDPRLVEFAWKLPLWMKFRTGTGKVILRKLLDRYVPRTLIERPKTGFGIPVHDWVRGPLREWAEELLDEGRLRREGFLDPAPVRKRWKEHLSGRRNWLAPLWNVLMFQAWLEKERSQSHSQSQKEWDGTHAVA